MMMMMNWVLLLGVLMATAHDVTSSSSILDEAMFQDLFDPDDLSQLRQLMMVAKCEGPETETYYFEVQIRLVPDAANTDVCNVADQVLLGNDLNALLFNYGVGEAGADDEAVFEAGVCPQPTTATNRRRRELKKHNGFFWKGGGGCRFCLWDDRDGRRRNLGNWFTNSFAPMMESTLETAILTEIAQAHTSCLGETPTIDVDLLQVSQQDLDLTCEDGRVIEALESLNLVDVPLRNQNCGSCVSIDFSETARGSALHKGDWIGQQWRDHGLSIRATGGYSPGFKARIFDTADAWCIQSDGSYDFGSPNSQCQQGGLGIGSGGAQGEIGENCDPVGNVLIIQESNKQCPDANSFGGILTFEWDDPVLLSDIGLMDVDEDDQRLVIHYADGFFETFTYHGFGDNAVQRVVANKINVVKVEVMFPGTGAVTEINFCPECRPLEGHDEDHHCLLTEDHTTIEAQTVAYKENFESTSSEVAWVGGKRNSKPYFTGFLGKFYIYRAPPHKTFKVGRHANGVIFELDFYEIDGWGLRDQAAIYIDAERVNLGKFRSVNDEGHREGTTPLGISWKLDSIDTPRDRDFKTALDQRHRIRIVVPRSTSLLGDGELRMTLAHELTDVNRRACAGWDNVKVTVVHSCKDNIFNN